MTKIAFSSCYKPETMPEGNLFWSEVNPAPLYQWSSWSHPGEERKTRCLVLAGGQCLHGRHRYEHQKDWVWKTRRMGVFLLAPGEGLGFWPKILLALREQDKLFCSYIQRRSSSGSNRIVNHSPYPGTTRPEVRAAMVQKALWRRETSKYLTWVTCFTHKS